MTAQPTQAQIKRAVKGALDGGLPVGAVEIKPDGTIRILPDNEKPATNTQQPEW